MAFVRTDSLSRLDAAGRIAFESLDAGLILDLRSDHEVANEPNPFAGRAEYRNEPFLDPAWESQRDDLDETTRAGTYRRILLGNRRAIGAVVETVAAAAAAGPPGRTIVAHCAAGKDRTALLVALLLDVAGVDRDRIVADYVLTEERLGIPAMLAAMTGSEAERAEAELAWRTPPEAMTETLAWLDARFGGSRRFLRWCGVADPELDRIVDRLLD